MIGRGRNMDVVRYKLGMECGGWLWGVSVEWYIGGGP